MSTQPLVSIIIPTYNQAQWVSSAIESALAQSYNNIEVIVSDDASTDDTQEVIRTYITNRKVKVFRNADNLGRVPNYRKGLYEFATGDWVLNLDGDDYLVDPDFVKDAIESISSNPNVVLVVGGQLVKEGELTKSCLPTRKPKELLDGFTVFLRWNASTRVFPHFASLYRRELAISINCYRYDILSSDWESLRRLVLHGDVVLIGRPVGVWRGHEGNVSKIPDVGKFIDNLLSISAPYDYGISLGFSQNQLKAWKRETLSEYVSSYVKELIIGTGMSSGLKLVYAAMKIDRGTTAMAVVRLIANPKLWAKLVVKKTCGKTAMNDLRSFWRRIFWKYKIYTS